jgi:hypothetical protein
MVEARRKARLLIQCLQNGYVAVARGVAKELEDLPVHRPMEISMSYPLYYGLSDGMWIPCIGGTENDKNGSLIATVRYRSGKIERWTLPAGCWAHVTDNGDPNIPWVWQEKSKWPDWLQDQSRVLV